MREIKFKVWDKENKKFITSVQGKAHIGIDLNGNVYNLQDGSGGKERYELIEFTGLKDKNGKEIYEGDIIQCDHEKIGVIEYDDYYEGGGRFWPTWKDGDCCDICLDKKRWYYFEIIGNIYEDSELISHS